LAIAVWGAAGGWGLLHGRAWARRSVIITHSLWAAAVAGYFLSVAATPEGLDASGVVVGLCLTGAFLSVAVSAAGRPRRVPRDRL
jgi:hypothetical protein